MNRADLLRLAEAAIPDEESTLSDDLAAALDAIEPAIRADERARVVTYLRAFAQSMEILDSSVWAALTDAADRIEKGNLS